MTDEMSGSARRSAPFDEIAADLQRLRIESGDVSYAEIATRIADRREADGMSPAGARIARSTVYDVFRPGRRRINADLVAEIVVALGADEQEAAAWRRRCIAARVAAADASAESERSASHVRDATEARDGHGEPVTSPSAVIPHARAGDGEHDDPDLPRAGGADGPSVATLRLGVIVALMVGSVFLNLFGTAVHGALDLPVFLDMIGTATTAFVLGPWYGVVVGVVTNALGAIVTSPETVLFGLVNATGAVLWGYGMRTFARTVPRFILLNMLVALACTLVAVPLNGLLYDGDRSGHATDAYITALRTAQGMWLALFSVNFLASLVDKMIAGFVALGLARLVTPLQLSGRTISPLLLPRRGRPRRDDSGDGI